MIRVFDRPVRSRCSTARAAWACAAERAERAARAALHSSSSPGGRSRAVRGRRERAASAGHGRGGRSDPSASPRRGLARRHDRQPAPPAPRHGRARARARRAAHHEARSARAPGRPVRALHRGDAREVPEASREPSLGDGRRARVHRLEERLPRDREPAAAAARRRGLRPSRRAARRGGAGRLGALRQDHRRPRGASALRLRHGPGLQPDALRVLRDAGGDAELPPRAPRSWSARRRSSSSGASTATISARSSAR